ncbi:hypothetical protein NP233_g12148 [Leucocoprinus birnbaumii]|uniref:Copper radical oxidase n=1 Tax=Leucocoprinus birnbaumii TaxID=56174 RepID=A0AAD5YJQ2_9AGAR|nr:hypothetical protein NP233_g12148 [Leucocoprinus birnbaumii]
MVDIFALPDGKVLVIASNQTIIYDIEKDEETILPDIPNGVHVTNPFDGTATLLPLHPPDYTPEILVCGGSNSSDVAPPSELSSQDPASDQCSRITITPEGIKRGWEVERMLEARTLNEMILMPNGKVLIINGAQTGYAAFNAVQDLIGFADADHPAFTPSVYTPDARLGHRISNVGMPTTDIARVYHSSVTLTPNGNILIAGSNPNNGIVNDTIFHSEFRVEYLNPPYINVARPRLSNVPKRLNFNQEITVDVAIPPGLNKQASSIQVALMDLGFSSHAFHSSSRLVFMTASLSSNGRRLTIKTPPNNRIYPPGPAYIFLTVDDVTSAGVRVMVCRKLDRLTRFRHVWLHTFDRTRHILPRNLDPRDWSMVELERLVARAEILEQKWSGSGGVISPPRCGFRSINPNPHSLRAVALLGSYIICVDNPRHNLSTYRWIPKGLPLSDSNVVLEYEVPIRTRAFPQRHEEHSDYHKTYLDHALATFYVISIPGFEGTSEKALIAEVKIDRLHSRPHLANCAPILINPERKRIYSLEVKAGFVFVHFVNANPGDSVDLNILNLQTQDVSLYRLVSPIDLPQNALTTNGLPIRKFCVSETHIFWAISTSSASYFYAFSRPSSKEGPSKDSGRITLHATSHTTFSDLPFVDCHRIPMSTMLSSFITIDFKAGPVGTMGIHFFSCTQDGWMFKAESAIVPRPISGFRSILGVSEYSAEAEYVIGALTGPIPDEQFEGVSERPGGFQMLRVRKSKSQDNPHLSLMKMDLHPWVSEQDYVPGYSPHAYMLDFDPFRGTALVAVVDRHGYNELAIRDPS